MKKVYVANNYIATSNIFYIDALYQKLIISKWIAIHFRFCSSFSTS